VNLRFVGSLEVWLNLAIVLEGATEAQNKTDFLRNG
jgi:hypothetical protein